MIRYMLVFRAPLNAVQACKKAVFAVGAGERGNYTNCAFTTVGTDQFLPGDAANPHIGKVGGLEKVEEASVETLCDGKETLEKALEALKK